jgi:hypothetical protein
VVLVDGSSMMSLPDLSVLKWDASWPGFRFREAWFGSDAGVSSFSWESRLFLPLSFFRSSFWVGEETFRPKGKEWLGGKEERKKTH